MRLHGESLAKDGTYICFPIRMCQVILTELCVEVLFILYL